MEKNVLNTDLTGKVAVVTGAGGVLCSAFAKVLARAGAKVVMSGNNTVKKAASGKFVGVAHAIRGGYVLVQTGGYAVLPYSGTAPTVGFATLAADSNADAVADASGREVLVTEVDAAAQTAGVLF